MELQKTLKKIENEVDLKDDVFIYVRESCDKLTEILNKLQEFSLKDKTIKSNVDIPLRIDKVINKHIPDIIDNFLSFSLEYRNTQKIQYEGQLLTPKEIILTQLANVINEVNDIEEDFYEVNKFNLKANGKYLQNKYGNIHKKLDNKFLFDKKKIKKEKLIVKETTVIKEKKQEKNNYDVHHGSFMEIMLGFFLLLGVIIGVFSLYGNATINTYYENDVLQISMTKSAIERLYADRGNYEGISTELLEKARYIAITPNNNKVSVFPSEDNKSFNIAIDNRTPEVLCQLLPKFQSDLHPLAINISNLDRNMAESISDLEKKKLNGDWGNQNLKDCSKIQTNDIKTIVFKFQ